MLHPKDSSDLYYAPDQRVGAVVTFGLYRWEMRNVQVCRWLQERTIEHKLGS